MVQALVSSSSARACQASSLRAPYGNQGREVGQQPGKGPDPRRASWAVSWPFLSKQAKHVLCTSVFLAEKWVLPLQMSLCRFYEKMYIKLLEQGSLGASVR